MQRFLQANLILRKALPVVLTAAASVALTLGAATEAHCYSSQSVTVGYRSFNYGPSVVEAPTASKPESKIWHNDGHWWGILWDPAHDSFRVFRLDRQNWNSVGPNVDSRPNSASDCLWDGDHLYVASHAVSGANDSAYLYRLSYSPDAKEYYLDPGFPVEIMDKKTEALVIDKDSTGQIWAVWERSNKIWVNRTVGDDMTWGTKFELPVMGNGPKTDDIATVAAFGGDKIGVMWSNQNDGAIYFAVHHDDRDDMSWEPRETATTGLGAEADDHVNVKMNCDCNGNVYAVTKTDHREDEEPLIYLLRRDAEGTWTDSVFGYKKDDHTRPILLLDEENSRVHVFARCDKDGSIRHKSADMNNLVFEAGIGAECILSELETDINNPTSTKQHVDSSTGMVVLAADHTMQNYMHNFIEIEAGTDPPVEGTCLAMGEETHVGVVEGGYDATHAADGVVQTLVEASVNGRRAGYLDHTWAFHVTEGVATAFIMNASATWSRDRDRFLFSYSTDGQSWAPMVTVSGATAAAGGYEYAFPRHLTGRVLVRVKDTNRRWGRRYVDKLSVDYMALRCQTGDVSPPRMPSLHVSTVGICYKRFWSWNRYWPYAQVRDENGQIVRNASVTGAWHGGESRTVRTNWWGYAIFPGVATRSSDAVTFCVSDVSHPEFSHDTSRDAALCHTATMGTNARDAAFLASVSEPGDRPGIADGGDATDPTGEDLTPRVTPATYGLAQNSPNPFRSSTDIQFALPREERVEVRVYNALGQEVRTLVNNELAAGAHTIRWDGRDNLGRSVAAGVYLYRLQAGTFSEVRKMSYLR